MNLIRNELTIQKIKIKPFINLQKNKLLILYKKEYKKQMNDAGEHLTVKIDSQNSSETSEDDVNRKELLWETREEELLKIWMNEMKENSIKQGIAGRRTKKLYALFGVPATLVPIVLSGLSSLEIDPLVNSLLMIMTGSLIGISTFFNLGKKFAQHFEYEHKYDELARELEKELKKPKRHRIACDVYMEKIYMKYSGLNARAPMI